MASADGKWTVLQYDRSAGGSFNVWQDPNGKKYRTMKAAKEAGFKD